MKILIGTKIGFDLGTTAIVAVVEGKGIKINEPSVIAYDTFTEKVKAIGKDACKMIGRSPDSLTVIEPIREGCVFDYEAVQQMLAYYIQKICGNQIFKPNVIVSVPSEVSELDKRTILDLTTSSGAAKACVIEEPLAAAVGAGISLRSIEGTMIVDIGGGTTDIAIVSKGNVANSLSISVGGNNFDEAICREARHSKNIIIGKMTAESVKKQIGSARLPDAELAVRAVGKDYVSKLPKSVEINSTDVNRAIKPHLDEILDGIRNLLRISSPELNADVASEGIIVTGGGALIRGIDEYIEEKLNIRTVCAADPLFCVANGLGTLLKRTKQLEENGYVFKTSLDINDYDL